MKRTLVYFDDQDARRDKIVRGLGALAIAVRPVSSLAQAGATLAAEPKVELFLAAFSRLDDRTVRVIEKLKKARPDLSILVLSQTTDEETVLRLLNSDTAAGFAPPESTAAVLSLVRCEMARREGRDRGDAYGKTVRRLKAERAKNARRAGELEAVYEATLENLMTALDLRDVETFGHSQTVAKYSQVLARLLGVGDEARLEQIRKGALLHDVGKIAIPDSILKKPGALSPAEWAKIRLHPTLGHGLIKEIKMVEVIGHIILYHHERYDGTGYPRGLRKEKIPLEARIFALADALDAITAHRPYRKARDFNAARVEILRSSGTQFDPRAVEAFLSLKPENWEKIRFETTSRFPAVAEFSLLAKTVNT